jgi:group I intron endonuclease
MVIYQITCLVNGKRYIGQTEIRIANRFSMHRNEKARGPLYDDIREFGVDLFTVRVIKQCRDPAELNLEEVRLIALLKPEYNQARGGKGCSGYRYTPEQKFARSRQLIGNTYSKGHKMDKESLVKWSARQGEKRSIQARERIKIGCKNRPQIKPSVETIKAWIAGAAAKNKRPIVCLNDGLVFDTQKQAGNYYGIHNINTVLKGKYKHAGGYVFAYEDAV